MLKLNEPHENKHIYGRIGILTTFQSHKRKEILFLPLLFIMLILFSSCTTIENVVLPMAADYEAATEIEKKDLKVGVVSGPYGEMFMSAIAPLLVERGYTIELVYYDDYIQPNVALANNEIDMNMFQHYRYLNMFKFEYDMALTAITEIPTASMGIFSFKYGSIQMLDSNITVSIPNDSTNLARALQVLEAAGLVVIDMSVDKSKATVSDLIKNPYNLQFAYEEAHSLVKSLSDYDLSVINGNYALSGGLNLSDALYNETLVDGYVNVIAVKSGDLSSQFVTDIIDIVYSEEYRQAILQNDIYKGFQLPRNFFDNRDWGK